MLGMAAAERPAMRRLGRLPTALMTTVMIGLGRGGEAEGKGKKGNGSG